MDVPRREAAAQDGEVGEVAGLEGAQVDGFEVSDLVDFEEAEHLFDGRQFSSRKVF